VTVPYTKTVERSISRLVPVIVRGDSTLLEAYFECDSTNKVIMRSLEEYKSKNSTSSVKFDSGKLSYTTSKNKDTIYSRIDTVYINKETALPSKTEYKMTRAQAFFYTTGIVSICLLLVWIIIKTKNFFK
jgi:hypothetical protein